VNLRKDHYHTKNKTLVVASAATIYLWIFKTKLFIPSKRMFSFSPSRERKFNLLKPLGFILPIQP